MINFLARFVPLIPYPYSGESIPCVLCGCRERVTLSQHDRRLKRLTTVICRGCGLLRTDPMLIESELAEYYRSSYRFDYQLVGSSPPRRHLSRSRAEAARRVALLEPVIRSAGRVLDFGCGSGEFLEAGQSAGWAMEGVEPGSAYADYARQRGLIVQAGLDRVQGSFDAITANHVLEHLRDPLATLRQLVAMLRPDGVIYLSVPDMGPSSKPAFERLHFAHVHGFVPTTLDLLAARAGLAPDPRVPRQGTTCVYRLAAVSAEPDPAIAEAVLRGFHQVSPVRHVLTLGWLAPSLRRWQRDIRDSFK